MSASGSRDIINTMKHLFPNSESVSSLDFDRILTHVDTSNIKQTDYCIICSEPFPKDLDLFHCLSPNCDGLRYKGALSDQMKAGRQPRQSFMFADADKQLLELLQSPGLCSFKTVS